MARFQLKKETVRIISFIIGLKVQPMDKIDFEIKISDDSVNQYMDNKLLVDVIHKLKNGLGGIDGFSTLLDRDMDTSDPRRRLLEKIMDGVKKVNDIAVCLMILSRDQEPFFERIRVSTFLKQVWGNIFEDTETVKAQLHFHPDIINNKACVDADPRMFERIIQYAFQFIKYVNGETEYLEINPFAENKIRISIIFSRDASLKTLPTSKETIMQEFHSVEVRLALAIILKLLLINHGELLICSHNENRHNLILELPKG